MSKLKEILLKLLFPHKAVLIILTPISAAMVSYALAFENVNPVIAYTSYLISAYSLTTICMQIPCVINKFKHFKNSNKYISHYTKNIKLKIKISLYNTLFINIVYSLINLGSGFYFRSFWFHSLAVYYCLLAVMRFFLLKNVSQKNFGKNITYEYKHYRLCGIILIAMNIILSIVVFYMIYQNKGAEYHPIHTIALAAYTFLLVSLAITNVIKYKRYKSPVISAAKIINLASALVSVLSLETAMINTFGTTDTDNFKKIITSLTGAAVCIFILATGIYMTIHSTIQIKKLSKR